MSVMDLIHPYTYLNLPYCKYLVHTESLIPLTVGFMLTNLIRTMLLIRDEKVYANSRPSMYIAVKGLYQVRCLRHERPYGISQSYQDLNPRKDHQGRCDTAYSCPHISNCFPGSYAICSPFFVRTT